MHDFPRYCLTENTQLIPSLTRKSQPRLMKIRYRFDGELHLVHYNEAYDNVSHAAGSGDGQALAVVGIFLKEVS